MRLSIAAWCEGYVLQVISGERRGFTASLAAALLGLFSHVFGAAVAIKNFAFERGLATRYTAPVPMVVSIGNLSSGGTGKTPFAIHFAKRFEELFSVAVLTRGYKSAAESLKRPLLLSRNGRAEDLSSKYGDEPSLMASRLDRALIFVGKNRCRAACLAAKAGAELIILDDGMQYRKLARDLEIVMVDGAEPLGAGRMLPGGLLREPPEALSRADLIVANGVEKLEALKEKLRPFASCPVIGVQTKISAFRNGEGAVELPPGEKIGLFCGIAAPRRFVKGIEDLGFQIVGVECSRDHELPGQERLRSFAKACLHSGAKALLCTEKDWVKLDLKRGPFALPVLFAECRLEVVAGEDLFEALVESVKNNLEGCRVKR